MLTVRPLLRFSLFVILITACSLTSYSKNFSCISHSQKLTDTLPDVDSTQLSVFEKVEIEASVDINEWRNHLQKALFPIVEKAAKKKMKAGTYMVDVKFLVEKNGSISYVQALNDPGYGLAKGAEKAVKTGPKWSPGSIDGKPVRSYHTQPIGFVISE